MLGITADNTGFDVLGLVVGQLSAPDPAAIALLALLLFAVATLRRRVWFEAAPVRGQQGIGRTRTAANSGGQNDFQTNVPF